MIFNVNDYKSKVLGCWMGKNIGGTLGAPFEFRRQINDVSFYTQNLNGDPLPNDDLDIQLLWLIALEERGLDVDSILLSDYWQLYVTPHWAEYGTAKINMKSGLMPPNCGYENNEYRHSNGAFIRSEIWACIAPGHPRIAARYAYEDAIIDHGGGEGVDGEVFFAAFESAAFVEKDIY
jgi:ADP-ribosylglycohydrolase